MRLDDAKESEAIWLIHPNRSHALDRVLHKVEQPARYTGGELNSIAKDWADPTIRTKVVLAFPDIYELGGSNLGLQVLYDRLNRRPDLLAERAFCPWPDFEFYLRRDNIPLYGLETRHPLAIRHRRLQPVLRAAVHQRAHHAGPGRLSLRAATGVPSTRLIRGAPGCTIPSQ